jgi:hypothetical protein
MKIQANQDAMCGLEVHVPMPSCACAVGGRSLCSAEEWRRSAASADLLQTSPATGVVVLAWAQTQIFEVYYYRMYAALVVIAAAHALVLLPVRRC